MHREKRFKLRTVYLTLQVKTGTENKPVTSDKKKVKINLELCGVCISEC